MRMMVSLLCLLTLLAPAQEREFKSFYREAKTQLEQGQADQALKNFQEAFRLDPEAKRYRDEGNFFDFYLPRYQIALCYEKLADASEAKVWVDKSREALEEKVIRKKRDLLASYHADLKRIEDAAAKAVQQLANRYNTRLNEARGLLANNRFAEAKSAFEALTRLDPSRNEAAAGLAAIPTAKTTFLKGLSLDGERALISKDFAETEAVISKMVAVDPSSPEISGLRSKLASAREAAKKAAAEPVSVASNNPPKNTEPDRPKPKTTTNTPTRDSASIERARKQRERKELREQLLRSIEAYREGKLDLALDRLREIPADRGSKSGSYHWLRGLYLISIYEYSPSDQRDEQNKSEAQAAMGDLRRLMPDFKPDEKLYPDFVLAFFDQVGN